MAMAAIPIKAVAAQMLVAGRIADVSWARSIIFFDLALFYCIIL
jgi:hypothetical protein